MSKASIETYLNQLNNGKTKKDAARIYRFIKSNPLCQKDDLIRELKMTHQTVTARLSDLMNKGVVVVKGTSKTVTSTLSLFKVEERVEFIKNNIQEREKVSFNNWLKQGKNKFSKFLTQEVLESLR